MSLISALLKSGMRGLSVKNKTDRELLGLAARAATRGARDLTESEWWNPLEDSAQAFHLSVSLKFRIDHVYHDRFQVMVGDGDYWAIVPYDGNPYAATRRAIVMAAAKLAEGRYGH